MMETYFKIIEQKLSRRTLDRPFLIAVDGVDCAGKTTFARNLTLWLEDRNYHIIQSSIDGFHNPREIRYHKGSTPESYYNDSFDYNALKHVLLDPLRHPANRPFKTAVFDYRTDQKIDQPWQTAPDDAILIFDGVFLHRPEIIAYWDYSVFLDVSWETVIQRARKRDNHLFASPDELEQRYHERYTPGQKIYFREAHPRYRANLVIDNG